MLEFFSSSLDETELLEALLLLEETEAVGVVTDTVDTEVVGVDFAVEAFDPLEAGEAEVVSDVTAFGGLLVEEGFVVGEVLTPVPEGTDGTDAGFSLDLIGIFGIGSADFDGGNSLILSNAFVAAECLAA